MKRVNLIAVLLLVLPGIATALGLGELELKSGLNQPLEARITLLSATRDDLDSLRVGLADIEAFRRARIDRPFHLSLLKFEVVETKGGSDYIRISSKEPIREPYLNFLIDAAWSKGRLFREYTVLLDPPLYDPNAKRARVAVKTKPSATPSAPEPVSEPEPISEPEPASEPTLESSSQSWPTKVYESQAEQPVTEPEPVVQPGEDMAAGEEKTAQIDEPSPGPEVSQPAPDYSRFSGDEFGPARTGDTLWSVARDWRPDSSISIQQMMLALLRTNPEAFIDNNINGLKRGHILRMPDSTELASLSYEQALEEVRSQHALWEEARGSIAASTPDRPITADTGTGESTQSEESATTATAEDQSKLRLMAATEKGTTADSGEGGTTSDAGNVSESLALANEQLEAISQENVELKERLSEAESIIEDLKRLVVLKDDELASIQQQMAEGTVQEEGAQEEGSVEASETVPEEMESSSTEAEVVTPSEDTSATEEEQAQETQEASPPAEAQKPAADSVTKVTAAPPVEESMLDVVMGVLNQVIATIKDNLLILGGALAAVLLVIVGLKVISRRKSVAATNVDIDTESGAIPEFTGNEDETSLPADDGLEDLLSPGTSSDMDLDIAFSEGGDDTGHTDTTQLEMQEPMFTQEEPAEEQEDPLAEVNVFLAYEHFDQAEEFVRNAISNEPDNLDYHNKLLEVFYAAGNREGYEEAARVLHDKVNGAGPHWEMAQAMWQEISPNRALFEAPSGMEQEEGGAESQGMLDITAVSGDEADNTQGGGLDFDLGETADSGVDAGDLLNITGDREEGGILDVTSSTDHGLGGENLLDVTAAVGLDSMDQEQDVVMTEQEQQLLEMTSGGAGNLLDDDGGEDLLDITAHANLESEGIEEDLLDVTTAASVGAEGDDLFGGGSDENLSGDLGEDTLEFDLSGANEESAEDDNVIDFDTLAFNQEEQEEEGLDFGLDQDSMGLESSGGEDEGAELDLSINFDEGDAGEFDLELDDGSLETEGKHVLEQTFEFEGSESLFESEQEQQNNIQTLEMEINDDLAIQADEQEMEDSGFGIDLSIDDSSALDTDEPLSIDMGELEELGSGEIDPDLEKTVDVAGHENEDKAEGDFDMESTVKMPKTEMELTDETGEGDDDTVFVPRSSEGSSDDEIATKLDLAKAYVELGDNDSAKSILDEVIAEGNDEQRQQARELMGGIA